MQPRRARLNGGVRLGTDDGVMVEASDRLAGALLRGAIAQTSRAEARRAQRLGRILGDRRARELLFTLTDEVLRTDDDRRAMRRLRSLVAAGLPDAFGPVDRLGLRLAAATGGLAPALVA